MSTFPFPPVTPNESSVRLVSNTQANRSPHTGKFQTVDRQGEHLLLTMSFRNLKSADRRRMQAWVARMNGHEHRFTAYDHSYQPAGVLAVAEMVDVPFNATNWESADSSDGVIEDTDQGVRFSVGPGETSTDIRPTTSADGISNTVSGVSYAATISTMQPRPAPDGGQAPPAQLIIRDSAGVSPGSTSVSSEAKRHVAYATSPSTSLFIRPNGNSNNSGDFGASVEFAGLSVSRALLVDNGFNAMLRSEDFGNAAWTKGNSTVVADPAPPVIAPDGSATADELVEDATSSVTHILHQTYTRTSQVEFWTGSVYIKSNTSRRIELAVTAVSGGSQGAQFFDATSGTQTGTATASGSASSCYSSMHSVGNGWYRCRVSVRLPATTSARLIVALCDGANNTTTFNGDGTSGLYVWGAQLQRGGQLGRYIPTTAAAVTGTGQTGKRVWVKGLDPNTAGQRKQGDQVEINGHLAILTADLDGDASGVGLLEFSPRIPTAPADEAPVVLYRPHGLWILVEPEQGWSNRPGAFSDFTIEAVQDLQ